MSKILQNYPDPSRILDLYGSDALRLYIVSSPVVRAESIRFKESRVKEVVSKVLLPLWNSYRFFSKQATLYKKNTREEFVEKVIFADTVIDNVMDRWILADCQSLLRFIDKEMKGYGLFTVLPRLLNIIENLTNWYIRLNRKKLKGAVSLGDEDTKAALTTLLHVLFAIIRALAPFAPFITEHIYGRLEQDLNEMTSRFQDARSVHFLPFSTVQDSLFNKEIERKVSAIQKVIQLSRTVRERHNIALKTPLLSLVVIADEQVLSDVQSSQSYVKEELNVLSVTFTDDQEEYGILLSAKVDRPTLGKKLKKDV